jgi:site-specific DNA-methyltransferase (adenine-specific)
MTDWRVITGDSVDIMPTLPAECARIVIVDPPYNLNIRYGTHYNDRKSKFEYLAWFQRLMIPAKRLLAVDGSLWVLSDPRWGGHFQVILEGLGLHYRETIIWHETFGTYCESKFGRDHRPLYRFTRDPKRQCFHPTRVPSARQTIYHDRRANPAGRVPSNVWEFSRVCGTFKERLDGFPTQLPVALVRRVVETASDPGDLVMDLCGGSGTTGVACIELGRRYVGIELSPEFAERSRHRLAGVMPQPAQEPACAVAAST